jgi:hypothetical protein
MVIHEHIMHHEHDCCHESSEQDYPILLVRCSRHFAALLRMQLTVQLDY